MALFQKLLLLIRLHLLALLLPTLILEIYMLRLFVTTVVSLAITKPLALYQKFASFATPWNMKLGIVLLGNNHRCWLNLWVVLLQDWVSIMWSSPSRSLNH